MRVNIMYRSQSHDILLTDELERRLIQHAIEQQSRLRPFAMLQAWFKKTFA